MTDRAHDIVLFGATGFTGRSNALLDGAYGTGFRYAESMSFPKGPRGLVAASMVTGGLAGFAAASMYPPARKLLEKTVFPRPGQGPSKAARDAGYFKVRFVGETDPDASGARIRMTGRVEGHSDPGYGETAKMLGESALCLAEDAESLDARFGVLTPATAMGMRLVERLRRAGRTFEVECA